MREFLSKATTTEPNMEPVTIKDLTGYECKVNEGQQPLHAMCFETAGFAYLFIAYGPDQATSEFFQSIKFEGSDAKSWKELSLPDKELTMQFPANATYKQNGSTCSSWSGIVGSGLYSVLCRDKVGPIVTPEDQSNALDALAKDYSSISDKKMTLSRTFTFQGLPAREYRFGDDASGVDAIDLLCVAKTREYAFLVQSSGGTKVISADAANYFSSIKIGGTQ
jgi:hypothetical protein